jgi:hypothetical protein
MLSVLERFLRQSLPSLKVSIHSMNSNREQRDKTLTAPDQGVLACRIALEAAKSPDLSIEEHPIPNIQEGQTKNNPDKIAGTQIIYQGVFLPFPLSCFQMFREKRDSNQKQYCSAGTTQRCNFCVNGQLYWTRCASNHRVSRLLLWLEHIMTRRLQCSRTGHWCSWSDTSAFAVCS